MNELLNYRVYLNHIDHADDLANVFCKVYFDDLEYNKRNLSIEQGKPNLLTPPHVIDIVNTDTAQHRVYHLNQTLSLVEKYLGWLAQAAHASKYKPFIVSLIRRKLSKRKSTQFLEKEIFGDDH